ncbi:MAG TPA: TolC family protein [Candidatus Binatia bacterium]|nr:TolC family protein [Candidatus Binatia bacterium]
MSLKAFVVAIFASLLAFTAEAQEQRSNRAFVAEPIDKTIALAGEPQGQTALTLSELVAQALENNPEIQAAKRKVESARARAGQATYLEDPEVNFEAWGVPLNQPVNYRKANPLIFGMRQKLPFFGKLGLKGEIAGQEVKMIEEELRAKEQEIVAKVKSAYADYFMASKNVEIYKELLELVRYTSTTAEGLYQVGRAPQQDVIKALLERTELLNKLTWAEKELTTSQAKLNTLLSRPPSFPLGQPGEPALAPVDLQSSSLEKLAVEQRPELRALESSINKSERAVELAERNRKYPDFMVGLQYWFAPDQSPKHMYAPMVTLTIPFSPWTKGKHDYEIEEALAERQAARANLAAVKNMTLFEVREMSAKVAAAMKSVSIYRDGLLPQAEQAFQAAVAAYQTGGVNFMTLLDAQRTIRDVRMGYYKALVDYEQSRADLERAVGKELQ